jgi:FAD/FMN-containing dehydrogenase
VVEPGVVNADLSAAARPHGLFYAPDPSSQLACTLGGNVAENSGGPHTLKYGTTTNHVVALELVLPDGSCFELGSPTGFSPGLRLGRRGGRQRGHARHRHRRSSCASSRSRGGRDAARDLPGRGVGVPRGRRGDRGRARALGARDRRSAHDPRGRGFGVRRGLPRDAGRDPDRRARRTRVALPAQVERVRELCAGAGADRVEIARDEAERQRFWRARKGAFGAMGRLAPDLYVHDAVVPRRALPEVLAKVCEIGDRHRLTLSNVFHAGDGNLHPNISFDRRDPEMLARVMAAGEEILKLCVEPAA